MFRPCEHAHPAADRWPMFRSGGRHRHCSLPLALACASGAPYGGGFAVCTAAAAAEPHASASKRRLAIGARHGTCCVVFSSCQEEGRLLRVVCSCTSGCCVVVCSCFDCRQCGGAERGGAGPAAANLQALPIIRSGVLHRGDLRLRRVRASPKSRAFFGACNNTARIRVEPATRQIFE